MPSAKLYAVAFADGSIKIGVASCTEARWRQYARGPKAVCCIASPTIELQALRCEKWALLIASRMMLQKSGREWFYGRFCDAQMIVRAAFKRFGDRNATGWRYYDGVTPIGARGRSRVVLRQTGVCDG